VQHLEVAFCDLKSYRDGQATSSTSYHSGHTTKRSSPNSSRDKDYLKKAGINNEKTLAEVRRIMAEAENIETETVRKRTENQHRQLALLAKKLRLVIQAQAYAETGSIDGLMAVLQDLEAA